MPSPSASHLRTLWLKWKSLKLPWRKRWLAGTDLVGNTFWYFKPVLSSPRARRILQSNPRIAYSDIEISPQWHQWLRYTRPTPPSISEQQADVVRQRELRALAQAADERWAAKPSMLDKPRREILELGVGDGDVDIGRGFGVGGKKEENEEIAAGGKTLGGERAENPWKAKKGNPGEVWQPVAWVPRGPNK